MCASRSATWLLRLCGSVFALVPAGSAWCADVAWVETERLTASDGAASDYFGGFACMSGDVALIGAPFDDDNGASSGSAYVYRFDGNEWAEEQKLTPSDGAAQHWFGRSVSLSGDVALVGARWGYYGAAQYFGGAYMFRYVGSEWVEEQRLAPSDGGGGFGVDVSVCEDVALVGAHLNYAKGAAYVFRYDGGEWVEEQKLTASDGEADDWFGAAVSISGDLALVGAPTVAGPDLPGAAYAFRYDGVEWVEEQKLTASSDDGDDNFGRRVAMSEDVALVQGGMVVYVYRHDGVEWVEEQVLSRSDGAFLGYSVAVSGDVALVGDTYDDENGSESGAARLYRYDGVEWVEEQKLTASDGAAYNYLGHSVSVAGNKALVGGGYVGLNGAAYVFTLDEREFRRGDVDGNGVTSVLVDSLSLLEWGFTAGSTPACLDAADVDDNGTVSVLVDALGLLQWGFTAGTAPPSPGPARCGLDSTDDDVNCDAYGECD